MSPERLAVLEALADQIDCGVNPHTGVPWVMFHGRVGIQTNFRCIQPEDKDNSALSVDSTDPNPVYIECGAAPIGQPLTALTIFVSEYNPSQKMIGIDIVTQGGRYNIPLRLTGDGIEVGKAGEFLIARESQPGAWIDPKALYQS